MRGCLAATVSVWMTDWQKELPFTNLGRTVLALTDSQPSSAYRINKRQVKFPRRHP